MKKRGRIKEQGRAQISMEFLMVVGFAFLMTVPLVIIFYQQSQNLTTEVSASQVDKIASEIRDAADEVYYLGTPSKKTITVFMPETIKSIIIDNTTKIIFWVDSPNGDYEVVKWTVANLTGSLMNYSGIHHISAESYFNISLNSTCVRIGDVSQ
jgi:uncharacterized protein (UPF0333 family)